MDYQEAKDLYDELKNFEGKASFKGEDTVIDLFVLLPEEDAAALDMALFLRQHQSTGSFEISGPHNAAYTVIGINIAKQDYSNDTDYFAAMIVW
ncbi:hypothetical protein [Flavobacterium cyanobacteriorum]|nr:hypothetical protein [Flavobacterium cyanobacteriorum]